MDYSKYLNSKVQTIKPSGIRRFFDIAAEMKDCISLGVGEPDFATPLVAREAAVRSIEKGVTQYTSNQGLLELRVSIAKYLLEREGVAYDPRTEIILTVGASEGIDLALRGLISEGDEILVPEPSYVSYTPTVIMAGGVPVPIRCTADNNFIVDKEKLLAAITPKTKAIIMPFPNNPTGGIMTREEILEIRDILIEKDLIILADEIYSELTYGKKHCSFASIDGLKERTILLNGFSKGFAMTGWRLGYLCAPAPIVKQLLKIHQYVIMCAPTAAQYCALAALEDGYTNNFKDVENMREEYDRRRKYLLKSFKEMGLSCFEPLGAFYVFPNVKETTGKTGEEFAMDLLNTYKLAVVPGDAFGESGKDYVRISYAYSMEKLEKAMAIFKDYISKNHK